MFETESNKRGGTSGTGLMVPEKGDKSYLPADKAQSPAAALRAKNAFMDSEQGVQIHSNLLGHYLRELDRQSENRIEMAIDEDIYDHTQYTDEDLRILAARGQVPMVFNITHTTINWVLGSQRRSNADFKVLARTKEGTKAAERKTELLKIVDDANQFAVEEANAFAMAVKAGVGWLETGQASPDDPAKVLLRAENWRSMLWDSTAIRYDLEDSRYQFRTRWMDADEVDALWPLRRATVEQSVVPNGVLGLHTMDFYGDNAMDHREAEHFNQFRSHGNTALFTGQRDRLRCIEAWFRRIVPDAAMVRGGQFNGELFDPWSEGHVNDLNEGRASLSVRPRSVMHCAIMTEAGLLDIRRTPYRHNRFPFTPIWGYRRARDGMPYGMIRGIRDIQRDMNRRAAKALHHLSATRVHVEEGAVDDIEELRDEAARPDAVIVHKEGKPAPTVSTDTDIASAHLELMRQDAAMIQQIGGVTDENLGRRTNATSGIAIERRQNQGQLATSMFFDNLAASRRIHGGKTIVNIETFYSEPDEFRVLDQRGRPDWRTINDGSPDNAIAAFAADFVITDEDWRATVRQAQAGELMDLLGKLAPTAPELALAILDLVVEGLDVPKRDEIVKRIRQHTGADDPDADPENPSPEKQAADQYKSMQMEMAMRQSQAALDEMEAKARKANAEATKSEAAAVTDHIAQLTQAFEAAIAIAGAPAVARAADQILGEALARAGQGQPAAPAPMQQQPVPPAAQPMGAPQHLPTETGVM